MKLVSKCNYKILADFLIPKSYYRKWRIEDFEYKSINYKLCFYIFLDR